MMKTAARECGRFLLEVDNTLWSCHRVWETNRYAAPAALLYPTKTPGSAPRIPCAKGTGIGADVFIPTTIHALCTVLL